MKLFTPQNREEEDKMKFKYSIPSEIKEFITNADLKEISIGCSDSQVIRINKDII